MKKKYILVALTLIFCCMMQATVAQESRRYDSLKVFYVGFRTTHVISIDASYLSSGYGDSIKFFNKKELGKLYTSLLSMKKRISEKGLKNIRRRYPAGGLDLRMLFEFYSEGKRYPVGIARTSLMFVDDDVFVYERRKLNEIKVFSENLYDLADLPSE